MATSVIYRPHINDEARMVVDADAVVDLLLEMFVFVYCTAKPFFVLPILPAVVR